MTLNRENTAIVLDSTADFPDAQIRFPNMRSSRCTCASARRASATTSSSTRAASMRGCATSDALPTTSQPTPLDFASVYGALESYERIYSLHISAKLSGRSRARRSPQQTGGDGSGSSTPGRRRSGSRCWRSTSSGCSTRDRRRRDPGADRRHRENAEILFTVDTLEYLAKGGRIGRAQAFAGSLLKVKPILTIEDGEVVPLTRVRGRQKALDEFRRRFEEATNDGPGLRVGIAHAEAEETVEQLRTLVLETRPQAEIELVTTSARSSARTRSRHRRLLLPTDAVSRQARRRRSRASRCARSRRARARRSCSSAGTTHVVGCRVP